MSDNEVALENIEPSNRIIVKSLNFETDENGLREYFSKYGTVTAAEIAVNKSQNKSLGYGFVTFSSVEEATKANDQSIVHELDDRVVRTNFAKKRSNEKREGHGIKKLYIGKLPLQVNEKELKEYFGQFGKVSDAFISTVKYAPELNGYEQHKGYGFVTFESAEDANKAVKQESHVFKNESIFVKKAIPQSNEKSPKERRNKGDRNNNKGGRRNNNEGRRNNNEGRRNNKEGSSPSSQGKSSDSQQDSTSSSVGEKKAVVVKRKEDTKPEGSSSSTSSTTTTTTQTTTTKSTNKPTNTTSSNNNNNKGKIVVNQAPKTTIVISKNPVNPWTKSQTGGSQSQASDEYPTLSGGKKKSNVKKTTTTTTVTTTIINEKDDKEEN